MAITDESADGWEIKKVDGYDSPCWWQKKGGNGSVATIRTPGLFGDNAHYSVQDKTALLQMVVYRLIAMI